MPKRPGAGRKPLLYEKRRTPLSISLPPAVVDWLDTQEDSRSVTVEYALREVFGMEMMKGGEKR